MNIVSFLVNVIVGLWLVPYLVKYLGKAAYGLIPLAMIFTEYINVITISINGSITRFLTVDIQNNDWKNANKTFNSAFFALLILIGIQIPIFSYITFDMTNIINVPEEIIEDGYYLFAFTFAGYLVSLLSTNFSTSMYAYNRLDLTRSVDVIRVLARLLFIIVLFVIDKPTLKYVGIANFIAAIVSCAFAFVYWKILTPKLKFSVKSFNWQVLRKIGNIGGWLIVNQLGYLLFLKIDLLVINRFIGPEVGGEYAAVQQWNSLIRTVGTVLSGVIGPMILISFAKNKIQDVIRFGKLGVKFLALSIGLLTGIVCGFSESLLTSWIGSDFAEFDSLLIIMLSTMVINLGILPLFPITVALNKVKIPGILTVILGIANLFLAIIFIAWFEKDIIGVALAGALVLTLKNGIFIPLYVAYILKVNWMTFYKPLANGILVFGLAFILSTIINHCFFTSSFITLIIYFIVVAVCCFFVIWFFLFKKADKQLLLGLIPKFRS